MMDDKRVELLRSGEEINLELKDTTDAWKRFVKSLPQYMDGITDDFEKPSIKTEWLKKKTR